MSKAFEIHGLNVIRTSTDRSETIVLIHAVGHDLTYWDRQIEAFSPQYNVVAFDLPGHGRSKGNPADWSFDYAANIVGHLLDEVSQTPVHLVGISFGGMIAQVTALARPDKIRTLTLIGTASTLPMYVRKEMQDRAEAVRSGGMAVVVETSLQRWFTQEFRERRPDIIDRITKTLLSDDPATHAAIWDLIATLETQDRLPEISCPTLILVGKLDPSTPPAAATQIAAAIPNATRIVIPDVSHIVTVEAPEAVNEAIFEFLAWQNRPPYDAAPPIDPSS